MESVKDEFYPDYENFLFKADSDEEDNECCDEATFESGPIKNLGNAETVIRGKKHNNGIFKPFVNKLSRKRKNKEKEKATVVAPGENQKFDNTFKFQEEKCFPTLFPKGT